ncbi:MAG: peptidyl-prolyl cis-trans isomerase, partial [Proteobacteria bacterium]|nr:peptidyl-prolyl cis-trans isomerase [Pseudomonadota bacterium]
MTLLQRLRRWLHEPLMQFLLGGLLVFAWSSWRGEVADPASKTVTVTPDRVELLAANFSQTWQRGPSPAELDGLIKDYVKEEIYYREAKRMGLDLDDPIVRRRLRSKMEFLSQAELENQHPSDAVLQAW